MPANIPDAPGTSSKLPNLKSQIVARNPIDSSVFARDLNTGQWTRLAPKGDVAPPLRVAHAQSAIESSQDLYIFGGRQG